MSPIITKLLVIMSVHKRTVCFTYTALKTVKIHHTGFVQQILACGIKVFCSNKANYENLIATQY
jgi:hypothetical protein